LRALSLILAILLSPPSWADEPREVSQEGPKHSRKVHSKKVSSTNDRIVPVDFVLPKKKSFPTFLFLPGLHSRLPIDEPALVELAEMGYGVATVSFSTQPHAVFSLEDGVTPYFRTHKMALTDFAFEVEELAESLASLYKIKHIIPVSLSFSGAVTPYLKKFPLVVETSPLTSSSAANPNGEAYRAMLKGAELFNPFFGERATRQALDATYIGTFSGDVDQIIKVTGLPATRRGDLIEGYSTMSRAVEGFDWKKVDVPIEVQRVFLIAGKESAVLKSDQWATVKRLQERNYKVSAIEIEGANHLITETHGPQYVEALAQIARDFDCKASLKSR